ncbi:MAG: ABC transporter permease [Gluconacetobacter diazotrophicus]|nr:ABC transporter permease [Gluconacetobacter diazotrophicus]
MLAGRVGSAVLSLLILTAIAFTLSHLTPGGPAYSILGPAAKPASIAAINHEFGLDLPLPQQYGRWIRGLLRGDLGRSYLSNRPVGALLLDYERNTIVLQLVALLASLVVSLAAGMAHGVFFERRLGRAIGAAELALYASPSFFTGTLLILFLSMGLGWFPAGGLEDLRLPHQTAGSVLSHLALPALTITLFTVPTLSRYFAGSIHEELERDYVRSATARGASASRVLFRHVLRNALRPVVTILGLSLPTIFAGGIVTETVFSYPGLGWLLWQSALGQDYPVLIGIVLVIGVLTVLGNLLADLVNGLLDPRVSYA